MRVPFMILAVVSLAAALWSGLQRFGWPLPLLQPTLPMSHGPLMVCGFLGTLISLERAVALRQAWAYLAPLAGGIGGVLLVIGHGAAGTVLVTLSSALLVAVFVVLLRRQNERFMQVMAAGAAALLIGNLFWLFGAGIPQVVHWWIGFLILTIAGERLELSRMLMHTRSVDNLFAGIAIAFGFGLMLTTLYADAGTRVTGVTIVLLGLWLARYDIARRTARMSGLTRYVGICLLSGYAWLLAGGVMMASIGAQMAGPYYDAYLHAVFVGFVFSMIFGHAPIIFPSVLNVPMFYRPALYVPLALLHLSLLVRTAGDLALLADVRRWGGMGTALAIVLFLLTVAVSLAIEMKAQKSGRAT
jgi:hypothetical protein